MNVGFYLLGPLLGSLWQIFVDYGSTHQIWQHIAKGSTQARALWVTENTLQYNGSVWWERGDHSSHTITGGNLSLHTFSTSAMPNNTAILCPYKGLKSLNRFTVIRQLIHEQVNVTALSQPQHYGPKCKYMFSFATVTEIGEIRRKHAQTWNCSSQHIWIILRKQVMVSGNTPLLGFC